MPPCSQRDCLLQWGGSWHGEVHIHALREDTLMRIFDLEAKSQNPESSWWFSTHCTGLCDIQGKPVWSGLQARKVYRDPFVALPEPGNSKGQYSPWSGQQLPQHWSTSTTSRGAAQPPPTPIAIQASGSKLSVVTSLVGQDLDSSLTFL